MLLKLILAGKPNSGFRPGGTHHLSSHLTLSSVVYHRRPSWHTRASCLIHMATCFFPEFFQTKERGISKWDPLKVSHLPSYSSYLCKGSVLYLWPQSQEEQPLLSRGSPPAVPSEWTEPKSVNATEQKTTTQSLPSSQQRKGTPRSTQRSGSRNAIPNATVHLCSLGKSEKGQIIQKLWNRRTWKCKLLKKKSMCLLTPSNGSSHYTHLGSQSS